MKGYQIIEPKQLNSLFSRPVHDAFSVAFLSWICEILRIEFRDRLQYVEFDVICVTYVGSYASIGIHYKDQNYEDIGPRVEKAIARILRNRSAEELVGFIGRDQTNWRKVAAKLLSRE